MNFREFYFQRLSGKCLTGVILAYALRHGEQEIPHGLVRPRMALHQPTSSPAHRVGTTEGSHGLRAILDAIFSIFYVLKSGCAWRLLPQDFPPWKTVYDWFRRWRIDGTWERLNAELRERLRLGLGRDPNPSAAIVDSQSVRTTGVGGNERGFDPAKKVEGRKRHLLVDTEGFVLEARVHNAKVPDEDGIRLLLDPARECVSQGFRIYGLTLATKGGAGRGRRRFGA